MRPEVETLVLDQLRAIRGEMVGMGDSIQAMNAEMSTMRHHLDGVVTAQARHRSDIASIKVRLDRIERRLELAD